MYLGSDNMVNNEIQKKDELSECICALYDDQIYKFKITTNPQDIDYLIEEYINGLDIYIFESTDANSLDNNEKELVEKFFPYLGKFRLEGKLKSTHNYFYPIGGSEMVNTLFSTSNSASKSLVSTPKLSARFIFFKALGFFTSIETFLRVSKLSFNFSKEPS